MFEALYQSLVLISKPYLKVLPYIRARRGKECTERIPERFGMASTSRPKGKLVWIHAASNGETLSALPLIHHLEALPSSPTILVTTMTVSAAELIRKRTDSERIIHQFIPYDHPDWIARFHKHWTPDLVLWIESELWPMHLKKLRDNNKPAILLNARLSDKSVKRWQIVRKRFQDMMKAFDVILAQTERDCKNLQSLGLENVAVKGNLKNLALPLPYDGYALQDMQNCIGDRPVIAFASTHEPEETFAAELHLKLKADFPDLLTIIIPRHPKRGEQLAHTLKDPKLEVALRSLKMSPRPHTDLYIADTLGEMGLFYSLAPIVFVGNSIADTKPGGGHNLLEPAWFDCAILSGSDLHNFSVLAEEMPQAEACQIVKDRDELYHALKTLLSDKETVTRMATNARSYVEEKQQNGLQNIISAIEPTCKTAGLL